MKKKKNNIINFPSSPSKLERQVEAILFAASEPLDIETIEKRQGLKVACIEEIAFDKGYISKKQLVSIANEMSSNQYGQYLQSLID